MEKEYQEIKKTDIKRCYLTNDHEIAVIYEMDGLEWTGEIVGMSEDYWKVYLY